MARAWARVAPSTIAIRVHWTQLSRKEFLVSKIGLAKIRKVFCLLSPCPFRYVAVSSLGDLVLCPPVCSQPSVTLVDLGIHNQNHVNH